jgi:hypothetical protein
MPRKSSSRNDWGVLELAREKPLAATAVAAGAAAAGLFLWSKRSQISDQLSGLSDQLGQWTEGMRGGTGEFDDTAGLTTTGRTTTGSRSSTRQRGMSETGGGNASLGRRSGGGGTRATSGRRRVQAQPTTPQ